MTYERWKESVDKVLKHMCGEDSDGITDWEYFEAYEDGMSPSTAAIKALKNHKYAMGY